MRKNQYNWSSAKAHVYRRYDPILLDDCYLTKEIDDWSVYLMEKDDITIINAIRQNTKTGRPCGDRNFVIKIEKILGRRLAALPRGIPHKKK